MHERAGLLSRYGVLVLPFLISAYYLAQLYGGQWSNLATMVLFTLACGGYLPNNAEGVEYARPHHSLLRQLANAISAGIPAIELARGLTRPPFSIPQPSDLLLERMVALQLFGANSFRGLRGAYSGRLEPSDSPTIQGWARDAARPDQPVDIDIYDGDRLIETIRSEDFREDLAKAGKGNGKLRFRYRLPRNLCDGKQHAIHVRFAGTTIDLEQSPRSIVCEATSD
jgi:hypothetical protein